MVRVRVRVKVRMKVTVRVRVTVTVRVRVSVGRILYAPGLIMNACCRAGGRRRVGGVVPVGVVVNEYLLSRFQPNPASLTRASLNCPL